MEFVTLHSKNGGIIDHNNKKDIIVSTVFSGDENKFFLAQASGPLVLTGGEPIRMSSREEILWSGIIHFQSALSFNQRHSAVEPVHKC